MTGSSQKTRTTWQKLVFIAGWIINCAEFVVQPITLLIVRVLIALEFWRSGMTKFNSDDNGATLFEYEYIPNWENNATQNIWGVEVTFPVPSVELGSYMAMYGELILAAMLILGLGGRFAAAGLFVMALIIETFVYPGTLQHAYWMMIFALFVVTGPGALSIDHAIRRKVLEKKPICGFCVKKNHSKAKLPDGECMDTNVSKSNDIIA